SETTDPQSPAVGKTGPRKQIRSPTHHRERAYSESRGKHPAVPMKNRRCCSPHTPLRARLRSRGRYGKHASLATDASAANPRQPLSQGAQERTYRRVFQSPATPAELKAGGP